MKRKLLAVLLTLAVLISAIPLSVTATVEPPKTLGAPEHFGVGTSYGTSVYFTVSAPEDIRSYTDSRYVDNPDAKGLSLYYQIDYKIDNGSWHHTSDWDSPKTDPYKKIYRYFQFVSGEYYHDSASHNLNSFFPEDTELKVFDEQGWEYIKTHSVTFRIRFAQSFDGDDTYVLSPWSKEFILSANSKADYDKLINHAPALLSAEVIQHGDTPYFYINTDRIPAEVQDLNAIAKNAMRTEMWVRTAGEADFRPLETQEWFQELIKISPEDIFRGQSVKNYKEAGYEIKARYVLDLRNYRQSGHEGSTRSVNIYSPFSNVISHNMPAWGNASTWATAELKKADDAGLIPEILKGADLTKPITREEFCELALLLYEKSTGKSPAAATPNPFTDTKNLQVLKAFALGITTGTSAITFSPQVLINREQCATMLYRALRVIAPGGDYGIAGVKDFPDQKNISAYAVEGTKYMSKLGIIKGDNNGNFMPKATTTAQEATGYGAATREASILMSVRSYDQIESGALGTPTGDGSATQAAPAATPAPVTPKPTPVPRPTPAPAKAAAEGGGIAEWLIGTWGYSTSSEYVHLDIMYEFKKDGTFYRITSPVVMYVRTGNLFEGKYKVTGDKLILTDIVKSIGPARSYFDKIWYFEIESYTSRNIEWENEEWTISRTDGGTLMIGDTEFDRGR